MIIPLVLDDAVLSNAHHDIVIVFFFTARVTKLIVGYEPLDRSFEVRLGCSVVGTLCQNASLLAIVCSIICVIQSLAYICILCVSGSVHVQVVMYP